jgi:hypothetical protein
MRKLVAAVQTKRHHHLSLACQNLPKDQNPPKAAIETDMGPPDTKYPAKKRELDVNHIKIAYDIVYDVIYDVVYDVVYYVIYNVAVGKNNHACGGDVQSLLSKPKEITINSTHNPHHSHSINHTQDLNQRSFDHN